MPLLKLDRFCLHYGEQTIFDQLDLQLDRGQKLCLVGRNGVGKSTLLNCIQGAVEPDSGERWIQQGIQVAGLSQELPAETEENVFDFVARGLNQLGADLVAYDHLSREAEPDMRQLEVLQQRIEAADGWRIQNRVQQVITRLELSPQAYMKNLSGGWRRRVALAQVLVSEPDVLLLDEPTNHLDIGAIAWLEDFLINFSGALIFITHDRAFLRKVANRVAELDRGKLSVWRGGYEGFLKFREESLAAEEKQNELFDKKLQQEEVWIRQGIKARRTRNEGRVRALEAMREERSNRLGRIGNVKLEAAGDSLSGKLVSELDQVCFGWGDKKIIDNFSCRVLRGDKIGLLGPNGIGKTTLLKILLGELKPNSGKVKIGTKISVAYFDQLREQLDQEKDARDNVAGGQDFIDINGKRRHVMSYLQDFLFSGERARTPIKTLSGGERNRILLAKLFSQPSNLLVMDEPTNDLDLETLELLEDLLSAYDGTLLLVSHDREFMDNVVSSTIAFEGDGKLYEYVGGYQEWIRQGGSWPDSLAGKTDPGRDNNSAAQGVKQKTVVKDNSRKKISYKLQRELDELPKKIEKLEDVLSSLQKEIAAPDFYQLHSNDTGAVLERYALLESDLRALYSRWEELDAMSQGQD